MYTNPLLLPTGSPALPGDAEEKAWHENAHIGDPFVLRFNGRYYLYPSTSGDIPGVRCWTSEDLVHWTYLGLAARDEALRRAYAPEVAYFRGVFYMVGSPKGEGHYLYAADRPEGPYRRVRGNFGRTIDGSIFRDNDGKLYFTHAEFPCLYGSRMEKTGELGKDRPIAGTSMGHWTEGPGIFFRGGKYYITMTGNHLLSRGYRVDYAVSEKGPLGPYRAPFEKTVLVNTEPLHGSLGHSSTTVGPDLDSCWIVYHNFPILPDGTRDKVRPRNANIDRMLFNGDKLVVSGPTTYPAPSPAPALFSARADSEEGAGLFDTSDGVSPCRELPCGDFTAEFNLVPSGDTRISFDQNGYEIALQGGTLSLISGGNPAAARDVSDILAPGALACVRLEKRRGLLNVLIDGMLRIAGAAAPGLGGRVRIRGARRVSHVAFSPYCSQTGDFLHYHASTRAIEAALFFRAFPAGESAPEGACGFRPEDGMRLVPGRDGGYDVALEKGDRLLYRVNCEKGGDFRALLRVRSEAGARLAIENESGRTCADVPPCGTFALAQAGALTFREGPGEFTLSCAEGSAVLSRIDLLPAVPAEENELSGLALCHAARQTQSLLQHDKGFIDRAEGLQMDRPVQAVAVYGAREHVDEAAEASVTFRRDANAKFAGIFLRLSEDSWHADQIECGMRGYFLGVSRSKARILRMDFSSLELASAPIPPLPREVPAVLKANVKDGVLTLWVNGERVLSCCDPDPLPYGRIAVGSFGARCTFSALKYTAD